MSGPFESVGKKESFPHIKTIERPEAIYRIIYDNHKLTHSPAEIGDADAYVSEFDPQIDFSETEGAVRAINKRWQRFHTRHGSNTNRQASETNPAFEARVRKMPYYMYDVADTNHSAENIEDAIIGIKTLEKGAAIAGVGYLGAKTITGQILSRREALKNALAAFAVAKGTAHFGTGRIGVGVDHERASSSQRFMQSFSETVNPETEAFNVTFRNAIWAHKLQRITQEVRGLGNKPTIDIQTGAGHSGLEDMLAADPVKRLEYIRRMAKIFSKIVKLGDGGIVISAVARFEFSETNNARIPTHTYRDPELEAIEKEVSKQ